MLKRLIAAVAAFLACASAAAKDAAPPQSLDELDNRVAAAVADTAIPGLAVAIVENGAVVSVKGYGYSDVTAKTPVTADTVFRVGSISKSITGIAAMKLVEEGKLSLDAKLAELAPEVKFENQWEATDPLRFAHLLEHTTGWPDITLDIFFMDGTGMTVKQGIDYASYLHASRWKPGHFSVYNNEGPAVAGYILEKLSGRDFFTLTRDDVLRPMAMVDAEFSKTPALTARLSKSYEASGKETPYQEIILAPSGSMLSSAKDLVRLVQFFLGRGTLDGVQILKPESIDRIERQETTVAARAGWLRGYGLGNAPFPHERYTFRGHNGGIDSFTSIYGYSVDCNCGYVILANGGPGIGFDDPVINPIQDYLMRNWKPQLPPEHKIAEADLEKYLGFYQSITPGNEYLRIAIENASLISGPVGLVNGHLVSSGVERVPTGDHSFRSINRPEPSLAFVEHEGRILRFSPFGAAELVPTWIVIAKAAVVALLVIGLIVSLVVLIVGFFTGVSDRGGTLVRLLPFSGIVLLLMTFALPAVASTMLGMAGTQMLRTHSPLSIAILICSLVFPVLGLLGLWRAVTASEAGFFVRTHGALMSALLLVAAAYMGSLGWLGVTTWNW
jgi:CubicO group peptidase (beta-lactamase class C family)